MEFRPESFFSLIFDTFSVQNQIKGQDFSYLWVTLGKEINIKLFLVVSLHIVLFRFEAKYKSNLKLNLYMDSGSNLK
jgi:hypothetical protein